MILSEEQFRLSHLYLARKRWVSVAPDVISHYGRFIYSRYELHSVKKKFPPGPQRRRIFSLYRILEITKPSRHYSGSIRKMNAQCELMYQRKRWKMPNATTGYLFWWGMK